MAQARLEELFSLEGKVVVVTGGGGFLAGAMARTMAQCGAQVAIADLSLKAAQKVADELTGVGRAALAVEADVLDGDSLEQAREVIVGEFGKIDCLINGAGGNRKEATTSEETSFFDLPAEAIQWATDLNFLGTLRACQVFGSEIVKQDSGSIVNISSMAALRPLTRVVAYGAAKAAVSNFTAWLAVHLCQEYGMGIRVNAIAPGFFLTGQNRYLLLDEQDNLTERGATIVSAIPQGRFGDPAELVSTAVWLLSDAASYVTGTVVPVDGGFNAFSGV